MDFQSIRKAEKVKHSTWGCKMSDEASSFAPGLVDNMSSVDLRLDIDKRRGVIMGVVGLVSRTLSIACWYSTTTVDGRNGSKIGGIPVDDWDGRTGVADWTATGADFGKAYAAVPADIGAGVEGADVFSVLMENWLW